MSRILEDLYFGELDVNTHKMNEGTALHKATTTMHDSEIKLMGLLEGKEKQLFLDYVNAWADGLMYPLIDIGLDGIDDLGKFGKQGLRICTVRSLRCIGNCYSLANLLSVVKDTMLEHMRCTRFYFRNISNKTHHPMGEDFFREPQYSIKLTAMQAKLYWQS